MNKKIVAIILLVALIIFASLPVVISKLSPIVYSKITADGLLGYIIQTISATGTIALAYVAIWQNKKIEEENEKAQERLERLTDRANELSIVCKIIDSEQDRILKLKQSLNSFFEYCNGEQILAVYGRSSQDKCLYTTELMNRRTYMLEEFNSLIFLVKHTNIIDITRITNSSLTLCDKAQKLIDKIIADPSDLKKEYDDLKQATLDFIRERNEYLSKEEENYSQLLYGNMTLEEIRCKFKRVMYESQNHNSIKEKLK